MKAVTKVSTDKEELAELLANDFVAEAGKYCEAGNKFRVAISGGNSPKLFFEALAADFGKKINWNNIEFYWADERCVAPDDEQSNYGMTKKCLFDRINVNELNVHRIKGEDNPQMEAIRYSELVNMSLEKANGLPQFDLILLGLGGDGHTASIFPDNLALFRVDEYYASAARPFAEQMRITITGKVINNAKRVWFLICGRDKAGIVSAIINQKTVSSGYPASYVKPAGGEPVFYLDKDAASGV